MALFEVGRVCMKIAGRDAGKQCVIVETIDDRFVLIDGQTRRRKVNVLHLEPLTQTVSVNSGANHEQVIKAFGELGVTVGTSKPRAHAPRILAKRKGTSSATPVAEKKEASVKSVKPAVNKAVPKKKE